MSSTPTPDPPASAFHVAEVVAFRLRDLPSATVARPTGTPDTAELLARIGGGVYLVTVAREEGC